jgi:hypothetical protein
MKTPTLGCRDNKRINSREKYIHLSIQKLMHYQSTRQFRWSCQTDSSRFNKNKYKPSMKRTKKVAVIGSGIMGSGIACHFANIS